LEILGKADQIFEKINAYNIFRCAHNDENILRGQEIAAINLEIYLKKD
jgi:hypothetical protein